MRVSLEWLRELCPVDASADAIATRLTGLGFEVEATERLGEGLDAVVVAEVLASRPHPQADRLTLVDVSDGVARRTIVCGAPNVPAPGGKVALANPGARLPGGLAVEARVVRGVDSAGMLCSETELGVGDDASGIMILDADSRVGAALADALALRDVVLHLGVTPNRPDALGLLGIARELAAALGAPLRAPDAEVAALEQGRAANAATSVEVLDAARCLRYVARVVEGACVGPSPFWLRRRLRAAGLRPISNVVDVTNYVLVELGQPLHAFDLARLRGERIVVRAARDGETIATLDGVTRTLAADDCLICDAERPIAIAGVMGGGDTEVRGETTRVLIEAACFEPRAIRRTSRRLGLRSESSLRFERGVDPNGVDRASRRAAQLICATSGGRLARGAVDVYPRPVAPRRVSLRGDRCRALLGAAVATGEMAARLASLGFGVTRTGDTLEVDAPTFRPDIAREADLCEEVARVGGLDAIPIALPPLHEGPRASGDALLEAVTDALAAEGLDEARSLAFMSPQDFGRLGVTRPDPRARCVTIRNPLGVEQSLLRTTLLPGLLGAVGRNLQHKAESIYLFEVGRVFFATRDVAPDERRHVAGILCGVRAGGFGERAEVELADVTGVLEGLAERLGWTLECQAAKETLLHPGQSARVLVGGEGRGLCGQIDPRLRQRFEIDRPCFAFELDLAGLPAPAPVRMRELPRFPTIVRDLSVIAGDHAWGEVRKTIAALGVPHLEDVCLIEDYRPGQGPRSLLLRFTYRAPERTLTDDEVNAAHESAVARLLASLGLARR